MRSRAISLHGRAQPCGARGRNYWSTQKWNFENSFKKKFWNRELSSSFCMICWSTITFTNSNARIVSSVENGGYNRVIYTKSVQSNTWPAQTEASRYTICPYYFALQSFIREGLNKHVVDSRPSLLFSFSFIPLVVCGIVLCY